MSVYFAPIRRWFLAKDPQGGKAIADALEGILSTANTASTTASGSAGDITTLQGDVTTLQTDVASALTSAADAALLTPYHQINPEEVVTIIQNVGGVAGGTSGQIQYNNGGVFGGFTASGDVTIDTATGAATIANDAVTYAKIQNAAANTFIARAASTSGDLSAVALSASQLAGRGSTGDVAPIGLGVGLAMSGTTLSETGATIPTSRLVAPQGRLTPVTGQPVLASDQTAKTHVYYTPYIGPAVPIYDGASWGLQVISSDLDLALDTSNHLINNVYDVFVWNNSGTISIGAGPAWITSATITVTIASPAVVTWTGHGLIESASVIFTTSGALPTGITAGTVYYVGRSPTANTFNLSTSVANSATGTFVNTSGSQSGTHTGTNRNLIRGTGAGTTELQMLNGIWTNKNSITLTNGAGGGTSVSANMATYVGSFFCTANGQTGMSSLPAAAAGGSFPALALYNAYNRIRTRSTSRDSTSSWTKSGTTWGAADNNANNRVLFLDGLQQSPIKASWMVNGSAGPGGPITGMALDSTTAAPQVTTQINSTTLVPATVDDQWSPQLGFHFVQAMEASTSASAGTFFGAQTSPSRQLNALIVELEL